MTPSEKLVSLTMAQRAAFSRLIKLGSNPYGWSALDLGTAGRTMLALSEAGLVIGGNVYGGRTNTYIASHLGEDVGSLLALSDRSREA